MGTQTRSCYRAQVSRGRGGGGGGELRHGAAIGLRSVGAGEGGGELRHGAAIGLRSVGAGGGGNSDTELLSGSGQ